MNVALWQLVLAVSIPTVVAMIGLLFNVIFNNRLADRMDKLSDRIDRQTVNFTNQVATLNVKIERQTESFNNQVTTLLTTIHGVDVRVVNWKRETNRPE